MTIKELVAQLQAYENQDANVTVEVGDIHGDESRDAQFEVFSDTSEMGFMTIFVVG